MSDWQDEPPLPPGVTRFPRENKRRNINQVITPHVQLDPDAERIETLLARLSASDGQILDQYKRFFPRVKEATGVASVSAMRHRDNSVVAFELRMAYRNNAKQYRTIFRADIFNSDNPKDDGDHQSSKWETLRDHGLYLPTNGPALFAAIDNYKAQASLRPVFLWCEGEKSRAALERRVSTSDALREFAALAYIPVTSATLGGLAGVAGTNYSFMPYSKCPPSSIRLGVNDKPLDLVVPMHFIVRDNDPAGLEEAERLGERLMLDFNVDEKSIRIVEPPPNATQGWDDADPLPIGVIESDRIQQLLAAVPYVKQRWQRTKKQEIKVESIGNCVKALKQLGVEACYDTAIGGAITKAPLEYNWRGADPTDGELLHVAYDAATRIMKLDDDAKNLRNATWRQAYELLLARTPRIDSIETETMTAIERGREFMSLDNRPEMLFIKAFNLPDNAYHRLCGLHLIRDIVAFRLRPAREGPALLPQLTYILYGLENCGKSTFVRALSGAHPTEGDAPRYSDNIGFYDLAVDSGNGQLQLFNKVRGVTAIELADRSLGVTVTRSQGDALKAFVNMGQVFYRRMRQNEMLSFKLRSPSIFTTNNPKPLAEEMGERRWVLLDLSLGVPDHLRKLPDADENKKAYIAATRNAGMMWVYQNLDAMLAHMYESDAWKNNMQASTELEALMPESHKEHHSEKNSEIALRDHITHWNEIAAHSGGLGVSSSDLQLCLRDVLGRAPPAQEYTTLLKKDGWFSNYTRIDGKTTSCWVTQKSPAKIAEWKNGVWVFRDRKEASPAALREMDLPHDVPF